jgi:hypothetical protein
MIDNAPQPFIPSSVGRTLGKHEVGTRQCVYGHSPTTLADP